MRRQVWLDGNQIYFFASFDTETVNELIKLIMKGKDKKGLTINLKTYGGSVDELFIAMDLVRKYDIRVHVMGYAISAGFYLLCAARQRSMEPTAYLLYHEISYGHKDTTTGHVRELSDTVKPNDVILKKVVTDTNAFTLEELEEYDSYKRDWYIYAEEAKERGLITYDEKTNRNNSVIIGAVSTEVK